MTHYWEPHVGGIERVAREQALRLADRGWEVRVASSRLDGDSSDEWSGALRVHRFRCANVLESRLDVPVPLMAPTMLRELARLARWADVVLVHGHVYIGSVYASIAARRVRTPLVLVQHSPFVSYGPALDLIERGVDRTLGAWVIRSATQVVVVSRFTRAFVGSIAPGVETLLVHPGVDTTRFTPSHDRRGRPRVFLTVRRLVPRNGVDVLIEAWRRAAPGGGARLVVVGDGSERNRLEAMSRGDPSIDIVGHIEERELPEAYRRADVFVLPSRAGEGFGLAAAEALASGLPVIASDAGGVSDLVRHGANGLIVPPANVDRLAEALTLLANDFDLWTRLRAGAQASIESVGWDRSIDQLDAILSDSRVDEASDLR